MQVQRTIQTVDTSHLVIEVPASFVHRQVEILVITLDETDSQPTRKRRVPPPQFAGQLKELGDVMSSVSVEQLSTTLTRKAGALDGRIKMSDDFNAPLADFSEYEK